MKLVFAAACPLLYQRGLNRFHLTQAEKGRRGGEAKKRREPSGHRSNLNAQLANCWNRDYQLWSPIYSTNCIGTKRSLSLSAVSLFPYCASNWLTQCTLSANWIQRLQMTTCRTTWCPLWDQARLSQRWIRQVNGEAVVSGLTGFGNLALTSGLGAQGSTQGLTCWIQCFEYPVSQVQSDCNLST